MASESVVKRPNGSAFILPYGFVQSPILASLALDKSKLGSYLRSLNGGRDCKVSVYVDDIIISSNDEALLAHIADKMPQVADEALFPLSSGKTEGPASQVTAFNIELSHMTLRVTESRLAAFQNAYQKAVSAPCKAGIASYVKSVNPAQVSRLMDSIVVD